MGNGIIACKTNREDFNMGEIKHDGIKGMKWGRRRYRNYDGTLTPDGKLRYYKDAKTIVKSTKTIADESRNIVSSAYRDRVKTSLKKKDYTKMTNEELRKEIERGNLERQYAQLTGQDKSRGKQSVMDALSIIGSVAAIGAASIAIVEGVNKLRGK